MVQFKNTGGRDANNFKVYFNFFGVFGTVLEPILRVEAMQQNPENSFLKVGESTDVYTESSTHDKNNIKFIKKGYMALEIFYVDPLNKS